MQSTASVIWNWALEGVTFAAHSITVILGLIALWGLIFHTKELALFFKVLVSIFVNERVKRLKETLGKLESLNFDEKSARREILALLGQVSGQIKPLVTPDNELGAIQKEILDILGKAVPLSEPTKRRIVYEIHGALDSLSFTNTRNLLR